MGIGSQLRGGRRRQQEGAMGQEGDEGTGEGLHK